MFTGIVSALGKIVSKTNKGNDFQMTVTAETAFLENSKGGDSIAVNGACLTMATAHTETFEVYVSAETAACTTLGKLNPGATVNLEHATRSDQALNGHIVSGHIDGVGKILKSYEVDDSRCFEITVATNLMKFIAAKGSICIDGVSLTVNAVQSAKFTVNIIPYTFTHTNFSNLNSGDVVNVEVDLIARYVARLLEAQQF